MKGNVNLGIRKPFSDLGATILDNFNVAGGEYGTSFLDQLQ
jgi:phosphopentomutase